MNKMGKRHRNIKPHMKDQQE